MFGIFFEAEDVKKQVLRMCLVALWFNCLYVHLLGSEQDNRLVKSTSQQRKPHCALSGSVSAEPCQTSQYTTPNRYLK